MKVGAAQIALGKTTMGEGARRRARGVDHHPARHKDTIEKAVGGRVGRVVMGRDGGSGAPCDIVVTKDYRGAGGAGGHNVDIPNTQRARPHRLAGVFQGDGGKKGGVGDFHPTAIGGQRHIGMRIGRPYLNDNPCAIFMAP